jgi:hypothetical protein
MNFAQFKFALRLATLPTEPISKDKIDGVKLMRYLAKHIEECKGKTHFDTLQGIEGDVKVLFGGDDHFAFWFNPYQQGKVVSIYFAGECPSGNLDRAVDAVFKYDFDLNINIEALDTKSEVIFGLAQNDLMRSMSMAMKDTNGFAAMIDKMGMPVVDEIASDTVLAIKDKKLKQSRLVTGEEALTSFLEGLGLIPRRASDSDKELDQLIDMMAHILFDAPLEIAQGIAGGLSEGMPESVAEIFKGALSHRAAGSIVDKESVKADMRKAFLQSMEEEFSSLLSPSVANSKEESDEKIQSIIDANIPGVKVSTEAESELPPEIRQLMSQATGLGLSVKAVRLDLSEVAKEDLPATMDRINQVLKAGAKTKD